MVDIYRFRYLVGTSDSFARGRESSETDQWRLVTDSTSVIYFHFKVSNVNKDANFYGIKCQ